MRYKYMMETNDNLQEALDAALAAILAAEKQLADARASLAELFDGDE